MNIRSLYLIVIVLSSLGLLYEWNSDQKNQSIEDHLSSVKSSEYIKNPDYISIENDLLSLVISISSGSIVESRLKEYPVENVTGSDGFRVFGSSESSSFKYYLKVVLLGLFQNIGYMILGMGMLS